MKNKFNINSYVYVKLTPLGLKIHKDEYSKLYAKYSEYLEYLPYTPPTIDEDGYSQFQMHELMSLFGPCMYLGAFAGAFALPFETEILFNKGDLT